MFQLRKDHMQAFEDAALRRFETEMVRHLGKFARKHSEILGEEGVRKVIRLGIERAMEYGLTNRGPMRSYIELMFMFGSDFDTDPQLPWAAEILGDKDEKDEMKRADRLFAKATAFLDVVGGPDHAYAKDALRRARGQRFEELPVPEGDFEQQVLGRLEANYPEKCHYVGEPALRTLVRRGLDLAKRHSVTSNAGKVLLIGLMFTLGHGFATDPQFPWIESTLANDNIRDPNRRAERLHEKAMTYLSHVLAYHGG